MNFFSLTNLRTSVLLKDLVDSFNIKLKKYLVAVFNDLICRPSLIEYSPQKKTMDLT